MGLFSSQKKSDRLAHDAWLALKSFEQLKEAEKLSWQQPVVLFKHSTRCSISHFVHRQLASEWNFEAEHIPFYYLDLISHRDLSNAIAEYTGVQHESPQIILWFKGNVLYHASHNNIDFEEIKRHAPDISN
jgi:bacillithiol system protein YtxJ